MNPKGGHSRPAAVHREGKWCPAVSFYAGVAVLALTSLYCVLPLLTHKAIPLGHDATFHVFQADQFLSGLRNGAIYPRWAADANNGYGSPNFIFYAPLTYYLVSFVHLWIPSLIMSMVFVIWAGFFLSGLSMFSVTRRTFGNPGSLLSAVTYQVLPFHVLDLYHRGTFAELFAYVWIPPFLCFLLETRTSENRRSALIGLSISYAGLIFTHLAVGFLLTVSAGIYFLHLFVSGEEKKGFFHAFLALLIGLGISAVYIAPAVWERKYVHIDTLLKYQLARNFLFDFQPRPYVIFYRFLHITVLLEASVFLLAIWLFRKATSERMREHTNRFLILLFIVSFLFATILSKPAWNWIPQFPMLSFPWRWIIVMEAVLCLLIASVFSREAVQRFRSASFMKLFIGAVFISFAQFPMQNILGADVSEHDLVRMKSMDRWSHIVDEKYEYLPAWTTNVEKLLSRGREARVRTLSGAAVTQVTEWSPESRTIEVRASSDAVIRLSTLYYPGWNITRNGEYSDIEVEGGTGALLVRVPGGTHTIRAIFEDTGFRKISKYASFASLLLLIPVTMLFGTSAGSGERRRLI